MKAPFEMPWLSVSFLLSQRRYTFELDGTAIVRRLHCIRCLSIIPDAEKELMDRDLSESQVQ